MVGTRALGMVSSDPQRTHVALHELAATVGLPEHAEAIGIASLVDGSALLSRTPTLPPGLRLADAVGPVQGRHTVVQVRAQGELRPNGADSAMSLGPFRARTFAAAVVGGPQDADAAWASRERLLAEAPEFLRRFVSGSSEAEALFISILAKLHTRGLLDAPQVQAELMAQLCRDALEHAGTDPRHVILTNGTDLIHVAAGLPSAIITVSGLSTDTAALLDPALIDSSMARERLRRFRGVLCLGALESPLKAQAPMPACATLQVLPDVATAVVSRDLSVKLL